MEDAILVTGGAGYIGSHTVRGLLEDGRRVVVLDDLSTGHRKVASLFLRVYGPDQFCFEEVDLLDPDALRGVFDRHEILGIIDFAARSLVAESQEKPRMYFDNNVLAFRNLVTTSKWGKSSIPLEKYRQSKIANATMCLTYTGNLPVYVHRSGPGKRQR